MAPIELQRKRLGKEHYPKIMEILREVSNRNSSNDSNYFSSDGWKEDSLTYYPEFNLDLINGSIHGWKDACFTNVDFVDDWQWPYVSLELFARFSDCQFKSFSLLGSKIHGLRFDSVGVRSLDITNSIVSEINLTGCSVPLVSFSTSALHFITLIDTATRQIDIQSVVGYSCDFVQVKSLSGKAYDYLPKVVKLVNTVFCWLNCYYTFELDVWVHTSLVSHVLIDQCSAKISFDSSKIYSLSPRGGKNNVEVNKCEVWFVTVYQENNRLAFEKTGINILIIKKLSTSNSSFFEIRDCRVWSLSISDSLINGRLWMYSVKFDIQQSYPLEKYLDGLKEKLEYIKGSEILNLSTSDKDKLCDEFDQMLKAVIENTDNSMYGAKVITSNINIVNGGILIERSDLGPSGIFGCDLSNVKTVVTDSDFSKVKIGNSQFNTTLTFDHTDTEKVLNARIEYLVQLKAIYIGKGDTYFQSKYSQLVAKAQEELYLYRAKKNWRLSDIADYLVHRLNWISNQHGESYLQALIFFGITTWVLFGLYLYSMGFRFSNICDKANWRFLGDYFVFIDPTHKSDFLHIPLTSWSKPIDFLSRILVAFCIYQFVAAFRKNTRKV